jgi:phage terminase large subunit-like protein
MRDLRVLAENFPAWCRAFHVSLFDWQQEAGGEAFRREHGRFVYRLAGVSTPRGDGKSDLAAKGGAWRLMTGPSPQLILSTALDFEGARIILDYGKRVLQSHPDLEAAVEVRADSIIVPSTGSRWLVRSREHTASRGLHPTLNLIDELGWVKDDELFASLLAAQASVLDPLTLVVSTVGRRQAGPLWQIKTLAEAGADAA